MQYRTLDLIENTRIEGNTINFIKNIPFVKEAEVVYGEILDLIYPRRCPVCDDIVVPKGALICLECRSRLRYIREPRCRKCGKQLHSMEKEFCYDCGKRKHLFVRGIALYDYQGIKESIYRFKYKGRAEYAEFFGMDIAEKLGKEILAWKPDALIPVPLHSSKLRRRTYNQAELLAEKIGKELSIPVYGKYVQRTRSTRPQKELDDMQRQKNVERAFNIGRNDVELKKTVVIDDIYTTGSTIDSVAAALLESGVEEIYFVTLSIGEGV